MVQATEWCISILEKKVLKCEFILKEKLETKQFKVFEEFKNELKQILDAIVK